MKARILIAAAAVMMLTSCGGGQKEKNSSGGYTLKGSAVCYAAEGDVEYTVFLSVETDKDGRILSITDDGTVTPDGKDDKYKKAQSMFDELTGKTADELGDVDTVTGATASGDAIVLAVKNALEQLQDSE